MTLPLFDHRPPVASGEVEALIAYLSGRGWCKAKSMADRWSDRQLRRLAHASHGQIVGGDLGYALVREISDAEADHIEARLLSQARQMTDRVREIRNARNRRVSSAA